MLRHIAIATTIVLCLAASDARAQAPAATAATGDAAHGKLLFEKTYRCYACHGYDGQTGSPRLVPQARNQVDFVAYVRKPRTEGMPKFADVGERDLADLYAYVKSIPAAAPPTDSIPFLKDVLQRRAQSAQTRGK